ncbi:unnamed protein product [Sphagnum troendelagicum]|uniref:Uncharacterized protein n=1 Tax=Sphagnum troendelagicum TaxID=128251 RepID=A0ABP0TII9_9BRYO
MICRLVLPVNVERDESVKGSSALGAADVRYAPMGVISFLPFIQLVDMFLCSMKNICFAVDTHFVTVLELRETNVILLDDILQDKIADIT